MSNEVIYPVDEMLKWLPNEKAWGHVTKYCAHPKLIEDLHCSFNPNVLPILRTTQLDSSSSTYKMIILLTTCLVQLPKHKVHMLEQIDCKLDHNPFQTLPTSIMVILG